MAYNRDIDDLEQHAIKWWPDNIREKEAEASIVPKLIDTQEKFLSIIRLAKRNPESVIKLLSTTEFPANLFLKHLMVISDFGSEPLQRVHRDFDTIFPEKKIEFAIDGKTHLHEFKGFPRKSTPNNKNLMTDGPGLQKITPVDDFYADLIIMLLFGSNSTDENTAGILYKCALGNLLGCDEELEQFVKRRYIEVSRIIGGSQSNDLGNAAQAYVVNYLSDSLGDDYKVSSNGTIPELYQSEGKLMPFDCVVCHDKKYVGIEVSFQVTTNSVIERKAGQAKDRYDLVTQKGHHIAYIIDGAGNFQRHSAVTTICDYSHCTVAYCDSEFDVLAEFIKEVTN